MKSTDFKSIKITTVLSIVFTAAYILCYAAVIAFQRNLLSRIMNVNDIDYDGLYFPVVLIVFAVICVLPCLCAEIMLIKSYNSTLALILAASGVGINLIAGGSVRALGNYFIARQGVNILSVYGSISTILRSIEPLFLTGGILAIVSAALYAFACKNISAGQKTD